MRLRKLKSAAASSTNATGPSSSQSTPRQHSHAAINVGDPGNKQWEFKVVFLGNSGVGKTWLMERVLGRHSHGNKQRTPGLAADASSGTIGVTINLSKTRLTDGGGTALLQLWDTSGAEKYHNLVRSYVPGAHCVVLMYEPSGGLQASRQALARWYAFAKDVETTATLFAVVAISRRAGGGGDDPGRKPLDEATEAGVNFGRVFASSLCGCFFHQSGGGGGRRQQREGLSPRWLTDQLVKRQQSRSEAAARLLAEQAKQQMMLVTAFGGRGEEPLVGTAAEEAGCFWCQRLLCCRPVRCSVGCGGGRSGLR